MSTDISFHFPYEIWEIITKYLDGKTIGSISQGCKILNLHMKNLTYNSNMWKNICEREINPTFLSLMSYKINGTFDERVKWFTIYRNWCRWQSINKHSFHIERICSINLKNTKISCVQLNGEYLWIGTNTGDILCYKNGELVNTIKVCLEKYAIHEILPIIDCISKVSKEYQYHQFLVTVGLYKKKRCRKYIYYNINDGTTFSYPTTYFSYNFKINSIATLDKCMARIEGIDCKNGFCEISNLTTGRLYFETIPLAVYLTRDKMFIFLTSGIYYTMCNSQNSGFTPVVRKGILALTYFSLIAVFSDTLFGFIDDRCFFIINLNNDESHVVRNKKGHFNVSCPFMLHGNIFITGDKKGYIHFYNIKEIIHSRCLNKHNSLLSIKVFSSKIEKINISEDVCGQIIIVATDNEVSFIKWGTKDL